MNYFYGPPNSDLIVLSSNEITYNIKLDKIREEINKIKTDIDLKKKEIEILESKKNVKYDTTIFFNSLIKESNINSKIDDINKKIEILINNLKKLIENEDDILFLLNKTKYHMNQIKKNRKI